MVDGTRFPMRTLPLVEKTHSSAIQELENTRRYLDDIYSRLSAAVEDDQLGLIVEQCRADSHQAINDLQIQLYKKAGILMERVKDGDDAETA